MKQEISSWNEIKFASRLWILILEIGLLNVCWPRQNMFSLLLVIWGLCLVVDYKFQVKTSVRGKDTEERYIKTWKVLA